MPHSVLLTGAFGQLGSRTLRHLLAAGHRVVAVDLQTPATTAIAAGFGSKLEVVWGNICDPVLWQRALTGIDTVVHLAAIIPPAANLNTKLATAVNQTATQELVKQMEASSTAKRLIFASSMGIFGSEQHRRTPPLTADTQPQPDDHYGQTKVEAERCIRASSLNWSILRLTVINSPEISLNDSGNIGLMFEGSATARVEIVHSDDAALAFANAVSCDAAIGKILFIGGGEGCRTHILDYYNRLLDAIGIGPIRAEALRPGPPYFFGDWVDTAESQRLLAFQRHSLDDLCASVRTNMGFKRRLLKLASPLINRMLERRSPHLSSK